MAHLFSTHAAEVRIRQPQSGTRNELALYVVHTRAGVTSSTRRPRHLFGTLQYVFHVPGKIPSFIQRHPGRRNKRSNDQTAEATAITILMSDPGSS